MRSATRTQEWFLRDPRTRKWFVQCAACSEFGRKPEIPDSIPKVNFEAMFPVMELDGAGLCEVCSGRR